MQNTNQAMINSLKPWAQNFCLPDGAQTAPELGNPDLLQTQWQAIENNLPKSMDGWTVLDVACCAGFYAIKFAQLGARVLACDPDARCIAQARWTISQFNLGRNVEFRQMDIYDLARVRTTFDLVCFIDAFNRIPYPLLGLDLAARRTGQLLVFKSPIMPGAEVQWPNLAYLKYSRPGVSVTGWIPNRAAVEMMMHANGMHILSRPDTETWFCERVDSAAEDDLTAAADGAAAGDGQAGAAV